MDASPKTLPAPFVPLDFLTSPMGPVLWPEIAAPPPLLTGEAETPDR
jgi:hypothetical protein